MGGICCTAGGDVFHWMCVLPLAIVLCDRVYV